MWVNDDFADSLAHEVRCRIVRFLVEHQITVGAHEGEASFSPAAFVFGTAFIRRSVQGAVFAEGSIDTRMGFFCPGSHGPILGLDLLHLCGIQRRVVGRNGIVRGSLKHVEMLSLPGDQGDRLNGGRAGTDDGHPLAGERDLFMGPQSRVVDWPGKLFQSFDLRPIRRRQAARG